MKQKRRVEYWPEVLTYLIPTVGMILLIVYNIIELYADQLTMVQSSVGFEKMLETIVTFISIVLSVFGFLIPAFLSSRGSNLLIQYFLDSIDVHCFVRQLKNVVVVGLIDVLFTSMLLLKDIFSASIMNVLLPLWLWLVLYFMCVSYRFISILLSIMVEPKEKRRKEVINEAPKETVSNLKKNIRKI